MLTCPYCQKSINEDDSVCSACSLSVEGANALLSPVPLLNRGLTDTTETLSDKQRNTIKKAITSFERTFPESNLNVVLRDFEPKYNLSTNLFWLFNSAGLSADHACLEGNQDILLGLDPNNGRLGLMVGYGLEPYVPKESILALLKLAQPALEAGNASEAVLLLITKLSLLLSNSSKAAKKALGI